MVYPQDRARFNETCVYPAIHERSMSLCLHLSGGFSASEQVAHSQKTNAPEAVRRCNGK
jgi:hypothetical protein